MHAFVRPLLAGVCIKYYTSPKKHAHNIHNNASTFETEISANKFRTLSLSRVECGRKRVAGTNHHTRHTRKHTNTHLKEYALMLVAAVDVAAATVAAGRAMVYALECTRLVFCVCVVFCVCICCCSTRYSLLRSTVCAFFLRFWYVVYCSKIYIHKPLKKINRNPRLAPIRQTASGYALRVSMIFHTPCCGYNGDNTTRRLFLVCWSAPSCSAATVLAGGTRPSYATSVGKLTRDDARNDVDTQQRRQARRNAKCSRVQRARVRCSLLGDEHTSSSVTHTRQQQPHVRDGWRVGGAHACCVSHSFGWLGICVVLHV